MKGRIIFISNQASPIADSGGGSVVIYRHLKRFKDAGHEVIFIHSKPKKVRQSNFREIHLAKKGWYPPLRRITPFLTTLRVWLYFKTLKKRFRKKRGDIILAILGDYSNLLATKLSKACRMPLYMVYHDDSLFNAYGKLNLLSSAHVKKIFDQTVHFFAVSEPMKALLDKKGAKSCSVLYPIPEGYSGPVKKWEDVDPNKLSFYNSGLLFEDLHLELIQTLANCAKKIEASISLIGRLKKPFEQQLVEQKNLYIKDRFDTIKELQNRLTTDADVLLVFYSFKPELEHRMFHSFPSKFAEYCHLGLPIVIIAPKESSIGQWALIHNWHSYLSDDGPAMILMLMKKLQEKEFWLMCRDQSLAAAKQNFDPDHIQAQLSSVLFA